MNIKPIRLHEVDGIRGWASLVVLLFHTFGEMFKYAVPDMNSPWLAPFFSGDIAVLVFFILSGDALSSGFFSGRNFRFIDRLLVRRYFRLTVPIFISCLATYLIMRMGLDFHAEASLILQRSDWLGNFLRFHESIFGLFHYSLIGVYVTPTSDKAYNPFLWTMSIEIIGSMLVFLLCYMWDRLKNPYLTCIALIVFLTCAGSFFALFFAGIYLGYLRKIGFLNQLILNKFYQIYCFLIIIAIVAVITFTANLDLSSVFRPIKIILSLMLIFCFYTHNGFKNFFSNRFSQFLGDISFPLYLIHFQVLISLMSWMVVKDYSNIGAVSQKHMLIIGAISIFVSVCAAQLFRFLEKSLLKMVDHHVLKILLV